MLPVANVGGLASGLDTNTIVSQLMDLERIPLRNLEARKAEFQKKDDAWQAINTRLSALHTAAKDLDRPSDWSSFVTVNSSNESAVVASATGGTEPGSFSFTVEQLAGTHQLASAMSFASPDAVVGAGTFTVTTADGDQSVTTVEGTTLSDLARAINDLDAGVTASVLAVDGASSRLLITADDTGTAAAFTASGTQSGLGSFDIVQQGTDAQLTIGSGAGAITVFRSTNSISDLFSGVTLDLQATTDQPVTVGVAHDVDTAIAKVQAFVDELNATLDELDAKSAYNAEADAAAPLTGDSTVRSLMLDLTSKVSYPVAGMTGTYTYAGSVGISVNREGRFTLDASKLREALDSDFEAVRDLFTEITATTDTRVEFVSATDRTLDGTYDIVVTQAAQLAEDVGTVYQSEATDTTFTLDTGTDSVDITVVKNSDLTSALQQINDGLTAAGLTSIAATDSGGAIRIAETRYGGAYGFTITGGAAFGLDGSFVGTDVAGTVGGEAATGSGRTLTPESGDPTGLVLTITAAQSEVDASGGSLSLGSITYGTGVAGRLERYLDTVEGVDGSVERARDRYQNQIDLIDDQIQRMEDRLAQKELLLIQQFSRLETAMNQLTAMGSALGAQLSSLMGGTA